MSEMTMAEAVLCGDTKTAITGFLMAAYGAAWAESPLPPVTTEEVVQAARKAYAMPIALGALRAAAVLIWETAPPDSDPAVLLSTIAANLELALRECAEEPSGRFWGHVASHRFDG